MNQILQLFLIITKYSFLKLFEALIANNYNLNFKIFFNGYKIKNKFAEIYFI